MNIIQSLIYGLISGLTEIFPISSQGHQVLISLIFGASYPSGLLNFFVHAGCLGAIILSCFPYLTKLRREQLISQRRGRTRGSNTVSRGVYEIRLLKTAAFPLILGVILYIIVGTMNIDIPVIGILFAVNGIALFIQEHISHGNKDASKMTALDGVLMGLSGVFAAFPGISRVGAMVCAGTARGVDRPRLINWIIVLGIPALLVSMASDVVTMFSVGLGIVSFAEFIGCIFAAIMAFIGAYAAIVGMRYLSVNIGFTFFAYYSWGIALLIFVFYLIA